MAETSNVAPITTVTELELELARQATLQLQRELQEQSHVKQLEIIASNQASAKEIENLRYKQLVELEAKKALDQKEIESKRANLEAVRLAQATIIENNRNKPVSDREITTEDITNMADALLNYINK